MRNHSITAPDQPSKLLGAVVPWAPIEYVVEAAGRCAVDDSVDGKLKKHSLACLADR